MASIKTILHITPFFSPNIGGVETHLQDLINELDRLDYQNIILTYSPLSTKVGYSKVEKIKKRSTVYRFPWIGHNLFHHFEKLPLLNLLYLTPYLFIRSFLFLLTNKIPIDTIHSHGLTAAIIGNILIKIFKANKHIVSIYSTYDNVPIGSFGTKFLAFTLNQANAVLTQSDSSVKQLKKIGVKDVSRYYHWIDLEKFKPQKKRNATLSTILFVGRMIPSKNVLLLVRIAKKMPHINFVFIGTGPDYQKIPNLPNIKLVGDVRYSELANYYQKASLLCVPSRYQEGWGRIIAESIACGTPVISSNLGGTVEAADSSVAIFVTPTYHNFFKQISFLINNPKTYLNLQKKCRRYATKHYSSQNISYITQHY